MRKQNLETYYYILKESFKNINFKTILNLKRTIYVSRLPHFLPARPYGRTGGLFLPASRQAGRQGWVTLTKTY
jgi:hypothetical protein